jgi:GNAT superfamily N-acetyltransferase
MRIQDHQVSCDPGRIAIEPLRSEHVAACVAVMRALPAWFGIEQAIQNYGHDLESCDGFAAVDCHRVVGFVGLKRYGGSSVEVNVIAVLPAHRRQGIGSRLLSAAERAVASAGATFLHTKTIAPSKIDAAYAESRAFWEAAGFVPLDEHLLWGPHNPCLVLVKVLG